MSQSWSKFGSAYGVAGVALVAILLGVVREELSDERHAGEQGVVPVERQQCRRPLLVPLAQLKWDVLVADELPDGVERRGDVGGEQAAVVLGYHTEDLIQGVRIDANQFRVPGGVPEQQAAAA
mmetsp:Transcript_71422/g.140251  ORF Transcript_71422/g.140251 Transcript_71422/m.140251 type:complete len:123 (-) Transcript_71422:140-508(-)